MPSYTNNKRFYPHSPDFPFWGSSYFSAEKRIMLVAHSALDKGFKISNTIYAILWSENIRQYSSKLRNCFEYWNFSRYISYVDVVLELWDLSPENIFVTDAFKYDKGTKRGYKQPRLLLEEINLLKPHYILPLGAAACECVTGSKQGPPVQMVSIGGEETQVIYCPFPAGLGRTRKEFPHTLAEATRTIWKEIHGVKEKDLVARAIVKKVVLEDILHTRMDQFYRAFGLT